MDATPGNGFFYMPNPQLSERTPRLSIVLNPFTSRMKCQRCATAGPKVQGWQEHDHNDKPEPIYIFLCERCSKELIGPHPRLYSQIWPNSPLPGIMDICADCLWRDRSRCTCPLAILNGGAGIKIDIERPSTAHLNFGGGRGCWQKIYPSPATGCSGKEIKP